MAEQLVDSTPWSSPGDVDTMIYPGVRGVGMLESGGVVGGCVKGLVFGRCQHPEG